MLRNFAWPSVIAKFEPPGLTCPTAPLRPSGAATVGEINPFGSSLPPQSFTLLSLPSVVGTPSKKPPHWNCVAFVPPHFESVAIEFRGKGN